MKDYDEIIMGRGEVVRAKAIARGAHQGQTDKAGRPYLEHPARVASRVNGDSTAEVIAWLHDVVEDTNITLKDLAQQFPPTVVDAVDAERSGPVRTRPSTTAELLETRSLGR